MSPYKPASTALALLLWTFPGSFFMFFSTGLMSYSRNRYIIRNLTSSVHYNGKTPEDGCLGLVVTRDNYHTRLARNFESRTIQSGQKLLAEICNYINEDSWIVSVGNNEDCYYWLMFSRKSSRSVAMKFVQLSISAFSKQQIWNFIRVGKLS